MSKKKKTTQKKVTVNKAQSQSQAKAVKPKKVKTATEQPKPSIIKTLFTSLFNILHIIYFIRMIRINMNFICSLYIM